MTLHDLFAGLFAARLVDRLPFVNRRVVGAVVPCQNVKRDFRDNGERKIKKSKEGASSSTSKVDEDLVRSSCLFSVSLLWHPFSPFHILGVSSILPRIPQEILKAKFMQQYWEGADRQGVLGNAKKNNNNYL